VLEVVVVGTIVVDVVDVVDVVVMGPIVGPMVCSKA
jgi:hypothetical protein